MNITLQRIAIAERFGWEHNPKWLPEEDYPYEWANGCTNSYSWAKCVNDLPDYLDDLNLCYEIEMSLSDISPAPNVKSDRTRYREILCVVCMGKNGPIHATSEQRCEAYLKTIEKWIE